MVLEFLGGAAFRAITGQLVSVWTKYQDHKHEMQMLKLQNELEDARAERQIKQQRLAADLNIRLVQVQAEGEAQVADAAAFREAMKSAFQPTGIRWVDAWNAAVRPAFATVVIVLWIKALAATGFHPTAWDLEMMGLVAGFFFADRQMRKSGK